MSRDPSLVGLLASPDVEGEGSIFNIEGHLLILLSSLGYKNPRILIYFCSNHGALMLY